MNNILTIFKKELHSFFTSPMAYIFLVVFALINGYFFNIQFFLINENLEITDVSFEILSALFR